MTTIGREALAEVDLLITQGADCTYAFRYSINDGTPVPVDLTGWSARMQLRRKVGGDVWLNLTHEDGITLGADGTVVVFISHAITEQPEWNAYSRLVAGEPVALGVHDLELISPENVVTRFIQGTVTVSPDVTRTEP